MEVVEGEEVQDLLGCFRVEGDSFGSLGLLSGSGRELSVEGVTR